MQSNHKRRSQQGDAPAQSVSDEPVRVGRGAVHVVRSSDPAALFGRTTVRFFAEGDQHEAAGWRDVILPPDDEAEPSVRAGSFDRVPRQTGAMVALVVIGLLLLAGVGYGVRAMSRTGWSLGSLASGLSQATVAVPLPPPAPLPPAPTVTPLPSASAPPTAEPIAAAAEATEPLADAQARPTAAGDGRGQHTEASKRTRRARAARAYLPSADQVLDRQGSPATTGEVAQPQPIDEPTIAPPPALAPPPEKAAPAPPTDPFEP